MPNREYFEARRYSAIILHDHRTSSFTDLTRAWHLQAAETIKLTDIAGWEINRVTYHSAKSYYPSPVRPAPRSDGQHPHEIYIARRRRGKQKSLTVLVAPYVRLLQHAVQRLDASLAGDSALLFARPDMNGMFEHFERTSYRHMRASRIEVTMKQSGLDRVALSGRNPLRSDLRQALHRVSIPYAIRVTCSQISDVRPTNVYADLHGNVWWYLSSEDSWGNVAPLLDVILNEVALEETGDMPLDRLKAADESEEESS